jgi:hypothetical protein
MQRSNRCQRLLLALALVIAGVCSVGYLAGAPGQQPIYVYLMAKVTDHVNLDMSEDRLRHILPMVERYRQQHPEAHVSAVVLFSGAISQALEERNARTHILDFVKDYLHRGVIEVGYNGSDEPTYNHRPQIQLLDEPSPFGRWKNRRTAADEFLTEARDPLTGAPVSGDGGLKKMQEVFGPAAYVSGLELSIQSFRAQKKLPTPPGNPGGVTPGMHSYPESGVFTEWGGDTETLQMLRPYNKSALMFGVAAKNPARLIGYSKAIEDFGQMMAPAPDTAPEVYWQDGALRLSEAAPPVHMVEALEGVEAVKGVLDQANRSKVQVVEVELGGLENYLQPDFAKTASNAPLNYAYAHPESPKLPTEDLRPDAQVAAGWAAEDGVLKWLTETEFPANPRDRFISNADLKQMAGSPDGFSLSTDALRRETAEALKDMGIGTHLFNYLHVDGHYLSLAELFQVMTDALAEYRQTGKLPQTVKVAAVHGPFRVVTGHGPNVGELTAGDLEAFCQTIDGPLHQETTDASGVPTNSIPPLVKLKDMDLNPAQLIRLMSEALENPGPETKLKVHMTYLVGAAGALAPKTRSLPDSGFIWTLKPAPLAIGN